MVSESKVDHAARIADLRESLALAREARDTAEQRAKEAVNPGYETDAEPLDESW
jgi:hypothetical protein